MSGPKIAATLHNFIKYKTIFSKRMQLLWYNYEKLKPPEKVITGMAESAWILLGFASTSKLTNRVTYMYAYA